MGRTGHKLNLAKSEVKNPEIGRSEIVVEIRPRGPQIGPFQPATRGVRELHVLKCCREDFAKLPKPTPAKFEGVTTMIARLHAKHEIGDRGSDYLKSDPCSLRNAITLTMSSFFLETRKKHLRTGNDGPGILEVSVSVGSSQVMPEFLLAYE
jgi:hypothetical protein